LHKSPRKLLALALALALAAWLGLGWAAAQADLATEHRLARLLLERQDIVGEALTLGDPAGGVVALRIDSRLPQRRGGVILLHDSHANADAADVIRPLRVGLADAGWDTLSVQLPVARPGSGSPDSSAVAQRLAQARQWFAGRDDDEVVVIAHGDSAGPALAGLADAADPAVRALVLVSSPSGTASADAFGRLRIPLLDVVAEFDAAPATAGRAERTDWARQAGEAGQAYRSLAIASADPGYGSTAGLLVARVRAWLAGIVDPQ
jgi:hypothetical protein